ncbi:MAG TPA: branched-chain amino acid aminotransferase, partial [Methylomirabilota bacterium]
MSEPIRITRTTRKKDRPKDKDLSFGTVFTDHMVVVDFEEEKGWYDPRVEPYGPLPLDPATAVLHYGQSLFEGLKAFRGKDGAIRLFRPQQHVDRLNRTARRMCIPPLDPELILRSWTTLVDVDRDWVPSSVGTSLYLRPTVIASEPFLGVRPARQYLYYVILSPVGPYYPEGLAPTRIKVIDNYVRACAGGLGEAKTSANYAASLYAAEEAKHEGFTQVLWLDGVHHKYIEEVGTSNIMLRVGDEVITPPLGGTILAGVTRDSALALMRSWGVRVAERQITIDEVVAAADDGRLREVWATGTAAVISPVGELAYQGRRIVVNQGRIGELAQKLYDTIVAIQYGEAPDP